jgi:sugar phosphate isomerase/epimerase
MIDRRKFIQVASSALAVTLSSDLTGIAGAASSCAWGVQLFSIPQMVTNDFSGTLKKLRDYGYRELEFFGPYSFSDPATIERWVGLAKQLGIKQNAFYGYKINEVGKMLKDNGLKSPSVHLDILTLRSNIKAAMTESKKLDVNYVVIPTLMDEKWSTADDFKRYADEFNKFGKQLSDGGIKFVYHNHGFEHVVLNGEMPLDILLKNTDPTYVTFELDFF